MPHAKTIKELIDEHASHTPQKIYMQDVQQTNALTYQQLQLKLQQYAQFFADNHIQKGQKIGFAMGNSIDSALTILGALYGGFCITAINLVAGAKSISYVIEHSECSLIIADADHESLMGEAQQSSDTPCSNQCPILRYDAIAPDIWARETSAETADIQPDDAGLLIYTSGTTGVPKGVVLSHKNLLAGANNTVLAHQLDANDKALCSLPLYHINGFCVTLLAPLLSGGAVVFDKKFSVKKFWDIISLYQCTWFSLVPTQIAYLTYAPQYKDFDVQKSASVRFGRSASSALAPSLQQEFQSKFNVPIIETMGLSETAAQILSNPLASEKHKSGSPGIAFGNQVKIIDPQEQELPANQEGELIIKGDNVMCYYLKNPEATRASFTADGWLKTGDLGKQDEDGYFFITGRAKELIIKGGENIAPREIDDIMLAYPNIIEAAAFGRDCKNYGQIVEAAIFSEDNSTFDTDKFLQYLVEQCGAFKAPSKIHLLNELPKGPSGKIQRLKLEDFC